MGMAASQARYLALVARKSNCEYEGQQINQARTVLSNQTANLFNQMLGLNVPVPPSTQDYTKVQYSFSDGVNNVTMDSWQQLGKSDENYNYVVTYHYNSNVYTGSQKQMNDPQVQFTTTGTNTDLKTLKASMTTLTSASIAYSGIQENYEKLKSNYESALKAKEEADSAYNVAENAMKKAETDKNKANESYNGAKTARETYENGDYKKIKEAYDTSATKLATDETASKTLSNYSKSKSTVNNSDVSSITNGYKIENVDYTEYDSLPDTDKTAVKSAIEALQSKGVLDASFDMSNVYYDATKGNIIFKDDISKVLATTTDIDLPLYKTGTGTDSVSKIAENYETTLTADNTDLTNKKNRYDSAEKQLQALKTTESEKKTASDIADTAFNEAKTSLASATLVQSTADATLKQAKEELDAFEAKNDTTIKNYDSAKKAYEALQSPEYVGNCKLKLLETLTEDQQAELKQVVKDMKAQNVDADINNCFDENGNYTGGIYQFTLNGKTYYSSIEGLYNSYNEGTGPNHIDDQSKLAYYNASYVSTKIEDTKKALLETDSQGRFTSIRLEDDTVQFTLNSETITDDAAYQDAMNQYYYENAQYDKMVQDINAKTSLIQQEDQQLELRLKQLDTEQNALSTEIDAVSKVVKDNVEKSFKTFGG